MSFQPIQPDPLHAAAILLDAHWRSSHTALTNAHEYMRDAAIIARNVKAALGDSFPGWVALNSPYPLAEVEELITFADSRLEDFVSATAAARQARGDNNNNPGTPKDEDPKAA